MNIMVVDKNRARGLLTYHNIELCDFVIVVQNDIFYYLKNRYYENINASDTYHKSNLTSHIDLIQCYEECNRDIIKLFENTIEGEDNE